MPLKIWRKCSFKCHYNRGMEAPKKRGRGRPEKAPDEKLHRVTLFLRLPEVEKVQRGGQEWVRRVLKRARLPPEK